MPDDKRRALSALQELGPLDDANRADLMEHEGVDDPWTIIDERRLPFVGVLADCRQAGIDDIHLTRSQIRRGSNRPYRFTCRSPRLG